MLDSKRQKCHAIIHTASAATGGIGAGLAQLPLADTIPITGIQIGMIVSIGKIYDIDLTESAAKALLAGFAAGTIGRNIAGVAFGWIPVLGNAFKATTAATLTESIGWAAVKHFEDLKKDKRNTTSKSEEDKKEEMENTLHKMKNTEYFIFASLRGVYFINNNEIDEETREYLEKIFLFLNSEIGNKINEEIQIIYISVNDLEKFKEYVMKLDKGSRKKLEDILFEIMNINTSPEKEVRFAKCLKIIKNIQEKNMESGILKTDIIKSMYIK